jgi:hypothetical protein
MNTMPVAYLDMLRLDIQDQLQTDDAQEVADRLVNIFNEYREDLKKIDFKMDIDRLKDDIKSSSDKLL